MRQLLILWDSLLSSVQAATRYHAQLAISEGWRLFWGAAGIHFANGMPGALTVLASSASSFCHSCLRGVGNTGSSVSLNTPQNKLSGTWEVKGFPFIGGAFCHKKFCIWQPIRLKKKKLEIGCFQLCWISISREKLCCFHLLMSSTHCRSRYWKGHWLNTHFPP